MVYKFPQRGHPSFRFKVLSDFLSMIINGFAGPLAYLIALEVIAIQTNLPSTRGESPCTDFINRFIPRRVFGVLDSFPIFKDRTVLPATCYSSTNASSNILPSFVRPNQELPTALKPILGRGGHIHEHHYQMLPNGSNQCLLAADHTAICSCLPSNTGSGELFLRLIRPASASAT